MKRLETRLDGPILIEPRVLGDERGVFCETYRRDAFAELGIPEEMVQDNHSRSGKGIVRGMHFQIGDGVAKLIALQRVIDVAMQRARVARAKQPFVPHVTLLYDKDGIDEQPIERIGWTVTEFVLIHSLLGRGQYIALARWPLRA